jgi:hypothetical protein
VISPREIVNFYNWRLLDDGSILYLDFSSFFDDLKPENEEAVRGWDDLFGYLLRPTEDGTGTDVHMIFDVRAFLLLYEGCHQFLTLYVNVFTV